MNIMERWWNRVAIVTGAGSGIGAATAKLLAANGMRIAAVDIDLSRVQSLAGELNACKYETHALQCDVTKEEDVVRVVKWTRDNLGGADVLVNSAGICYFFQLIDADSEKIRKLMDVNVLGTCLFNREVIQDMRDRHVYDGHLFHLNSVSGQSIVGLPGVCIYSGGKHTIRIMTEYLRRELRDIGTKIRVTNISPGMVGTNIFTSSGMATDEIEATINDNPLLSPDDIAHAVLYALSTPPHVQIHEITIKPIGEKF